MKRSRVSKQVGVYDPGAPSKGYPNRFVDEIEARRLTRNGEADRINRGKAIRLRGYSLRGESCAPGKGMIEAIAINGSCRASQVIAVAWSGGRL